MGAGFAIQKGVVMADNPSLFDSLVLHDFVLRGDDHQMPSCLSLFETRRNEGKIWSALLDMAKTYGTPAGYETWSIQVGYKALRTATGCGTRALERAWPSLLGWGFLEKIVEHHNRDCKKYFVCSEVRVDAEFKREGYTYFRVMPDGELRPFRPMPRDKQA